MGQEVRSTDDAIEAIPLEGDSAMPHITPFAVTRSCDALQAAPAAIDNSLDPVRFDSPVTHIERTELWELLQRSLQDLPVDQRLVIVLSDIEGCTYSEIAEIVGVPVGTVKSRLSRERLKIRSKLQSSRW